MKFGFTTALTLLPALLTGLASAQILRDQSNGILPTCASSCPTLTQAQTSCNGARNADAQAWSCFCQTVWANSGGALTTMCTTTCTNPSDNTLIEQWYTANCGSDNGASEHGGSSNGGNTGNVGSTPSSSAGAAGPSTTANQGISASDASSSGCSGDWFSCHWKWVVMVIVLAVALTALGFGGRWLKKRHDRKRDQSTTAFNTGITSRSAGGNPYPSQTPASSSAPMSQVQDPSFVASGDVSHVGRNSPSRTREAFMPYGYNYTRSESRLGGQERGGSSLARGATPVGEMERGVGGEVENPRKKSRRVMVREREDEGRI